MLLVARGDAITTGQRPLVFKRFAEDGLASPERRASLGDDAPSLVDDYLPVEWADMLDSSLAGGTVIMDPTYFCNMACRFCSLPITSRLSVDLPRLRPVLASLRLMGMRTLVLTGGEPGIYLDLHALLAMASEIGFRVSMLTNGTWASKPVSARETVSLGVAEVVLSLKAFDRATSRRLTGKDLHGRQMAAIANLGHLARAGALERLVVNHVLCTETMEALSRADWLDKLPREAVVVVALVEPYTAEMLPLVPPDPEALRGSLAGFLVAAASRGVRVLVEGLPLCMLGDHWLQSRDLDRNHSRRSVVFIKPEPEADYVLRYSGYQRILQFTHTPTCEGCALVKQCPGVHKKYADEWTSALRPLSVGLTALEP